MTDYTPPRIERSLPLLVCPLGRDMALIVDRVNFYFPTDRERLEYRAKTERRTDGYYMAYVIDGDANTLFVVATVDLGAQWELLVSSWIDLARERQQVWDQHSKIEWEHAAWPVPTGRGMTEDGVIIAIQEYQVENWMLGGREAE